MTDRHQTVRAFRPPHQVWFDQQFWPIFMALCITSAVLAATIVSLLDGFWMWTSLMILPAAFAVVAFTLRFIDDRRWQRSVQLAVILSLALHCCFVIFAKQTDIFTGFLFVDHRTPNTVNQPRMIHISRQVDEHFWQEPNEIEIPVPDEQPVTERIAQVETSPVRPQPTPVETQQPTNNPQVVRRQQTSRTVPRLGERVSTLRRQVENVQPKSSQPVPRAKPTATARSESTQAAASPAAETDIDRPQTQATQAALPRREPSTETVQQQPSASTSRRTVDRRRPSTPTSTARATVAESSSRPTATAAAATPTAPSARRPSQTPATPAAAQLGNVQRQSPVAAVPQRNVRRQSVQQASPTQQLAQRRPRETVNQPSVTNQNRLAQARRAVDVTPQPQSPQPVERPRATAQSNVAQGTANLQPQPMAVERSTSGTAGVGRSVNINRDLGSRASAAMNAADSMRRPESTSVRPDPNSFTARQASRVPRTTSEKAVPSSPMRAESLPLASRTAAQRQHELTANASAALTSSNSDARRGQFSAERGSGSADIGPTKIVSEAVNRRVEGGGQPEIQDQPSQQRVARLADSGAAAPAVATPMAEALASSDLESAAADQVADEPTPNAQADLLARDGGQAAISGGPTQSRVAGSEPSTSTAFEMAQSAIGESDSDDEDEELEAMRRLAGAASTAPARSSESSPDVEISIDELGGSLQSADGGSDSSLAEAAVEALRRSSENLPGSGIARATRGALAAAASSMPLVETGGRRGTSQRQTPRPANATANRGDSSSGATPTLDVGPTPEALSSPANSTGRSEQLSDAANVADVQRDAPAGMSLDIDARTGPAGISNSPQPNPGIDSRRASKDSPAIQSMTETRFRKDESGGTPSVSPAPVIAREPFRTRRNPARKRSAPQTEEAIEFGLAFLARYQQDDGSWTLSGFDDDRNDVAKLLSSDAAATGLALLAFQGAGYTHKEFKYAGQLELAVRWLLENQSGDGDFYVPADEQSDKVCRLYSHAIVTLALAEAYGMTQDESLREPIQRALAFIDDSQDPRLGGWRYRIGNGADTSVTGWMMMALQSGRLAGFETNEKTWLGIRGWLDGARMPDEAHLFRYNPLAEDTPTIRRSHGRRPSPCMTSVGLLMRLYMGWDRNDPRLTNGARYLLEQLPGDDSINVRDTYYWYYATQVLNHIGGEDWETWNNQLRPLLIRTQVRDGQMAGSWDPLRPVPDRWGGQAGRLYVTAMNLLSLEVDYRLLPLYEDTSD